MGGAAGVAGGAPDMAALLGAMGGAGGALGGATGGAPGSGAAGSGAMPDLGALMSMLGGMGGGMGGVGALGAPQPVADPETAYASQLQQLRVSGAACPDGAVLLRMSALMFVTHAPPVMLCLRLRPLRWRCLAAAPHATTACEIADAHHNTRAGAPPSPCAAGHGVL